MYMKVCIKCKVEKELAEFGLCNKAKDKLKSSCKICRKKEAKEYNIKNKDKRKEYKQKNSERIKHKNKEYYLKNKDIISKKTKIYVENNREKILKRNKERYENNKQIVSEKCKEYRLKNAEDIKRRKKDYYEKNKEIILKKQKEYRLKNKEKRNINERNRRANDNLFKITSSIRSLIGLSIRKNGYTKKSKTHHILGCSFEEFKIYIENQFKDGMSWDNRSEWHLDHIIPVSSAKTEEEIIKLNHYTNFQPLWAVDNLKKGTKY